MDLNILLTNWDSIILNTNILVAGLFGSKTRYYVSSVAYSLLGNEEPKNYFVNNMITGFIRKYKASYIIQSMISNGLAANIKNFYRWCKGNYKKVIGYGTSTFTKEASVNTEKLYLYLQNQNPNTVINITSAKIYNYDLQIIAEYYIKSLYPDNELTYSVTVFNDKIISTSGSGIGATRIVKSGIKVTFSDNNFFECNIQKVKQIYSRRSGISLGRNKYYWKDSTVLQEYEIPVDKSRYLYCTYEISTKTGTDSSGIPVYSTIKKSFVYAENSGNSSLDECMAIAGQSLIVSNTYLPFLPMRVNTRWYSDNYYSEVYEMVIKAWKKVTGLRKSKYTELIKNIEKGGSVGDIDYAFICLGIDLNTKYQEGRRYIFELLENIIENPAINNGTILPSEPNMNGGWLSGGSVTRTIVADNQDEWHYSYTITYPSLISTWGWEDSEKYMRVYGYSNSLNYDQYFAYGNGTIVYKSGIWNKNKCAVGKYYIYSKRAVYSYTGLVLDDESSDYSGEVSQIIEWTVFIHQESESRYKEIILSNFCHVNYIYHGKSVYVGAYEALNEEKHNESGFIFPLEINTFKQMNVLKANQFSQELYYIVFNCWVKKKQRWYQSGIFKFVGIIIAAVIGWFAGGPVGAFTGAIIAAATMVVTEIWGAKIGGIFAIIITIVLTVMQQYGSAAEMTMAQAIGEAAASPCLYVSMTFSVISLKGSLMQMKAQKITERCQQYVEGVNTRIEEINNMLTELTHQGLDIYSLQDALQYAGYESWDTYTYRTRDLVGSQVREFSLKLIHEFCDLTLDLTLEGMS